MAVPLPPAMVSARTTNKRTAKQQSAQKSAAKWFSLEWYQDTESLDALGWSNQIMKRVAIKFALAAGVKGSATADALMEDLIAEPMAFTPRRPYWTTSEVVANLPYASGSIIPLAHHDLDRLGALGGVFASHTDSAIDAWSRQNEQLSALTRFGHLKVDMNARDDDILSAFKHWLVTYRGMVGPSVGKPYRTERTEEMKDWHKSRILPYFDLITWKRWKSVDDLTENSIAELLFPEVESPSRHGLRSIEDKVDLIFTVENVIALSVV